MGVIYLASLLAGIVCMLLLDHRFRLFFWHDAKAATVVTAVGLAFFLAYQQMAAMPMPDFYGEDL